MSFVHTVRRALAKLRYPTVDADGNLIANVEPRTGTLADLLLVGDSGEGEIAVATDADVQVLYRAGVPYKMPMHGHSLIAAATSTFSIVAAATEVFVAVDNALIDVPTGVVDSANDRVNVPASLRDGASHLINATLKGTLAGAGVTWTLKLRTYDGSTWTVGELLDVITVPASGSIPISRNYAISLVLDSSKQAFSISVSHDSGVSQNIIPTQVILTVAR